MDFERGSKRGVRNLLLTPLIDVVFILIIFFMLTSSFMRIESLEMILPSSGGKAADKQEVIRLYLYANGDMQLGSRKVDSDALDETLNVMFQKDAGTKMMVLSEDGVTMQQLVNAMDRIYQTGGKSVFVRKWVKAKGASS
jgi:biopolymer transport protein ExbD